MANNDDHCVANAAWIMDTATEGRSVRSLARSLARSVARLVGQQPLKQCLSVSAARSQLASCSAMTLSDVTPARQRQV